MKRSTTAACQKEKSTAAEQENSELLNSKVKKNSYDIADEFYTAFLFMKIGLIPFRMLVSLDVHACII
jgi:hypothetical protein